MTVAARDCFHCLAAVLVGAAIQAQTSRPAAPEAKEATALVVTGKRQPLLENLDALMHSFLTRKKVPGGALGVTYRGRLVYARGFGYGDVEKKKAVQPDSLLRIASISKPITAVAILQLVEKGKLTLESKVCDILKPEPFKGQEMDPRMKQVTILQLLQHTGGWNRSASFDPMFRSHIIAEAAGHEGPATAQDVIRYMAGKPLDFDPGQYYAYSNFGYCLLGRVIEKTTGRSYGQHVKAAVLHPLGIAKAELGFTRKKGRLPGEVCYYGQDWRKARSVFKPETDLSVPWPYGGFYLEAMDSHGGWVASVVDLLRFACAFDDPGKSKLLGAESIERMFARPEGRPGWQRDGKPRRNYYACGWSVVPMSGGLLQEHGGSLPGTSTKLLRRPDGVNWVVLLNSRHDAKGTRFSMYEIQGVLERLLDKVREWPEDNLFDQLR